MASGYFAVISMKKLLVSNCLLSSSETEKFQFQYRTPTETQKLAMIMHRELYKFSNKC